ncbi:MAG: 5'-3'-deoxyribonucleotidase [Bacteroidota bacterium]
MNKQRIAIDMDEVMADFLSKAIQTYNQEFNASISLDDQQGKHFVESVPEAHLSEVRLYPYRPSFFRDLQIMKDCKEVVTELAGKYELFIVSAAMEFPNSLKDKREWLEEHFSFIHWQNIVLCGDKSIINADFLIDDHSKHLVNFVGEPLLFTAPHNINENRFKRVNDWQEVGNLLL